jgi:hypothetical protein
MALTSETAAKHTNGSTVEDGSHADTEFPTPYLGRSVRIVGEVVNVDMNQSPHPKNRVANWASRCLTGTTTRCPKIR